MKILNRFFVPIILILCLSSCVQENNPSASANLSQFIESISIVKKALEIDQGTIKEYDFLIFLTVADEKKDAVKSIDVTFPDGREVYITREEQTMPGHEHLCGFIKEDPEAPYAWFYRNIAMNSMDAYSDGIYQFTINHESGTENFAIKFLDPATGKLLPVPGFGKLLSPEENAELASPVSVSVGDHEKTIGLYFGLPDPDNGGFLEQKEYEIPRGINKSEPVDLVPGNWRGELNISEGASGEINGVSWQLDLVATTEFGFKVIEE
jgi:hypothetical protein